ncbi:MULTISPECIES: hypothetical protein [unclassified Roseateles]|uniref:hypothetical protein n=1 Tax=Pelomonas sp. Root1237 TaxID=1736434 RepID=UPI0006FF4B82|nr:hypothetical protein [Pelomonas sp. Root1237]KQV96606.1 hypothetical protein ASC91_03430 [Pelomonas sp. Root1237]
MQWRRKLIWCGSVVLAVGLLFADNLWGYYRFKTVCAAQGGMHGNQLLERDAGWMVREGHVASVRYPLSFEAVKFVRYRNEQDGLTYDVYRQEKHTVTDPGYVETAANLNEPVFYEHRFRLEDVPNELRLRSSSHEVIDLRTSEVIASYRTFLFSQFEQSRTLLAAPSLVHCPDDTLRIDPKTGKNMPGLMDQAFASLFKK